MKSIKRRYILAAVTGALLAVAACGDIAFQDNGGGNYRFGVTNGTGGYLESIKVGPMTCENLAPGEACVASYYYRPETVELSCSNEMKMGTGEAMNSLMAKKDADGKLTKFILNQGDDTNTVKAETTLGETDENYNLTLNSRYFALSVENLSDSNSVDGVGFNFTDDNAPVGLEEMIELKFPTSYNNVTDEAMSFPGNAVNHTFAQADFSNLTIYAEITGETLNNDVPGEAINVSVVTVDVLTFYRASQPLPNVVDITTYINKNSVKIYKDTIVVNNEIDDGELLAYDDGNGSLVSDGGFLNSTDEHGNTIDYKKGDIKISFLENQTDVKCKYSYSSPHSATLKKSPKKGSIVVKANGSIIAKDDGTGGFSGSGVIDGGSKVIDYTTGAIQLSLFGDLYGSEIMVEYAYDITSGTEISGGVSINEANVLFTLDLNAFDASHTITGIHADYHIPIAAANADNAFETSADEAVVFSEKIVSTDLAHGMINPVSPVTITATFDDGAGTVFNISITADGNGTLLDGANAVGAINFLAGSIEMDLSTYHDGIPLTVVSATYSYLDPGKSTKGWIGFFEKDKIDSIYPLTMSDESTIDSHWDLFGGDLVDEDYSVNEYGSFYINYICGN